MKFTLAWLKEHLDTSAPAEEIRDRLTMTGYYQGALAWGSEPASM